MTRSRTSSDRPKRQIARFLPGIIGPVLVVAGAGVIVGVYLGALVGAGVGVLLAGGFLLLIDRRIP